MDLKLHHFRSLLAVGDQGSIRAAARATGITQSALTRSLQEAQAAIGEPLFDRREGRLTATPTGEVVLASARAVVAGVDAAAVELQQLADQRRQQVAVAVAQPLGCTALPQAVRWFYARFPDTRLSLYDPSSVDAIAGLRSGQLDFAVVDDVPPSREDEFQHEPVGSYARSIVTRRAHPLRHGGTGALHAQEWVCSGGRSPGGTEKFLGLFDQAGVARPRRVHQSDYFMALQILRDSDALSVWPDALLDELGDGSLASVELPPLAPEPLHLALVRRRDLPLSSAGAYLAECIREAAAQPSADPAISWS
ncbi:LysR family transcriptional regulator [Ramlibacter sp. AW1]|uniref:LysR family transcriptional regulator n=1 Tax=Ramlibacter aurantiacus TaxID=2801330 RepID=A0A936ZS95_9BURK|nr:LysR family transcriptional regulator [Ramlibacter aurantiacus]MBL0421616.1 LysR family transcriptional regulator [Ramlibacter aurantiacus]